MVNENKNQDDKIIFIISQPRSGSTLLQHIFGSHPDIYTLPEPWLMLNFAYGLRSSGIQAEYNARHAYLALQDFLKRISGGEDSYLSAIRQAATYLYSKALELSDKNIFLDKTPRYYLILPELFRIFPNAKFIILVRNPLAVFSSILSTNFNGNWKRLFELEDRKQDLFSAPHLILDCINKPRGNTFIIKYEEVVNSPEHYIKDLCTKLNIDFYPEMLEYGGKVKFNNTTFVDPKSIYEHTRPVKKYTDRWITGLDTAQKTYLARKYLYFLGRQLVEDLGYSYEEMKNTLINSQLKSIYPLVPFSLMIKAKEELKLMERLWLFVTSSLQKHGVRGLIRITKNKLKSLIP